MVAKRSLALMIATATVTAAAVPAFADTSVPVTVLGLGGTRQFAVEDIAGAPLTALDLGSGGSQPFRTHVSDAAFLPTASGGNYDVTATLSNLYLKTGSGSTATDYSYNVKVPASDVAINFGSAPLSVNGLSLTVLPKITLTGALHSCTNLTAPLKSLLGLSVLGAVTSGNTALSTLCATLLVLDPLGLSAAPLTTTVDAALESVGSTLTDLTKLPTALSGTTGGSFTNPSFANGVGSFDTAGAAAAVGQTPTSVALMKGVTSGTISSALATDLLTQITALLPASLTSATGLDAKTQIASVVSQLQASATPVLSQLGAVLNSLSTSAQSQLINSLFTTVTGVLPALADLKGVTGSSYAFPVLSATPTTPVAGTYGGTMTVTFVQS